MQEIWKNHHREKLNFLIGSKSQNTGLTYFEKYLQVSGSVKNQVALGHGAKLIGSTLTANVITTY